MSFLEKIPLFRKEDPDWDDGTDNDYEDPDDSAVRNSTIIMGIYGAVSGFFGWQYVEYLHQRFACNAWGVEFTSRRIQGYSVVQLPMDIMSFLGVYGFIFGIGAVIYWLVKMYLERDRKTASEIMNTAAMRGVLIMVIVSIIMLIVPWNIFMIGID